MRIWVWLFNAFFVWSAAGAALDFNFAGESEGSTPSKFESVLLGGGAPPVWKIVADDVPSGFQAVGSKTPLLNHSMVLAQTSADMTDERYPMFIYTGDEFRDFKFSTKFKIVSGITEQMAGVVFRFQNASNFYVVRISALGKNIGFYKMVNGQIVTPVKLALTIAPGDWHTLEVDCAGNYIDCLVDGQKALPTITDNSPPPGKIGFWTKSDSVTHFTDATLTYTPRIPAGQRMVDTILQKEPRILDLRIYTLDGDHSTKVIAAKDKADLGAAGADAEWQAIQTGKVFFGREKGAVILTLSLRDRNGDNIAAMRLKLKSFFGETQDSALTRATIIRKQLEALCPDDSQLGP